MCLPLARLLRKESRYKAAPELDNFFLPHLCSGETVLVLVLLAQLLVLALVLAEPVSGQFNWSRLALCSMFVQWIVLLSAALLCLLRPWLAHFSTAWVSFCCCLLVVLLTLLFTALADYFRIYAMLNGGSGLELYLRHALISLILAVLALRYFYLQSEWRRQQQAELHARIEALQARIKPHFLFNCLNSIATLVTIDPLKAEQAVLDLSDVFRATLATSGSLTRWADELELARRYLSIEQYRLGQRLQLQWDISGVPEDVPIPQLTLQPLLENALIHGVQMRMEPSLLEVKASFTEGLFHLCVSNPFDAGTLLKKGSGQALANIESRLHALFGDGAKLWTKQADGRFLTCLRYPCELTNSEKLSRNRSD